jgi:hypothetical protein
MFYLNQLSATDMESVFSAEIYKGSAFDLSDIAVKDPFLYVSKYQILKRIAEVMSRLVPFVVNNKVST